MICDSLVIISCQLMLTLMSQLSQIGLNKVSPYPGGSRRDWPLLAMLAILILAMHYGKPGKTMPLCSLVFLMSQEVFLSDKKARDVFPNVKIPLKLDMKAQTLHKTTYFSC